MAGAEPAGLHPEAAGRLAARRWLAARDARYTYRRIHQAVDRLYFDPSDAWPRHLSDGYCMAAIVADAAEEARLAAAMGAADADLAARLDEAAGPIEVDGWQLRINALGLPTAGRGEGGPRCA